MRGRFVALRGNQGALAAGRRYLARDLNRGWSPEQLRELRAGPAAALVAEDREQRTLADIQETLVGERRGPVVFLDLHSTSAPSTPFLCFGDTLANRALAMRLPITKILGLEEVIDGAMLGYWADRGHTAIAIEAGQHDAPETERRHQAALWLCAVAIGLVESALVPDLDAHHELLVRACAGRPSVVEVLHRQVVAEGDGFTMRPGFASFDVVRAGTVLARDRSGDIRASRDGILLMPRYQGQGDDGFFLAREVAPFWLRVSRLLRALPTERLLPLLPGVSRDLDDPHTLSVNPDRLRHHLVDMMHLCGYRRRRQRGATLLFSRRPSEGRLLF